MSPGDPLLYAIKLIGSRQEVAKLLGISIKRLDRWLNGGICMGYEYAVALEHLTGGQVTAEELAPQKIKVLKKLKINLAYPAAWVARKQIAIADIHIPENFSEDSGDLKKLAQTINCHGLLRPIVMDKQNGLISGERQIRACELLGKKIVFTSVISLEALLKTPRVEHELKKYFIFSETIAIGMALEKLLGDRRGKPSKLQNNIRRKFGELKGRTDQFVSELLGLGKKDAYRQAKKVLKQGVRLLIDAMDEGKMSVFAAAEIASLPKEIQQIILTENDNYTTNFIKQLKATKKLSTEATPETTMF